MTVLQYDPTQAKTEQVVHFGTTCSVNFIYFLLRFSSGQIPFTPAIIIK